MIDASARRHQAHKIYLRVAAAKRWVFNRNYVVSNLKIHELAVQLRYIDGILHDVCSFSRIFQCCITSMLITVWCIRKLPTLPTNLLLWIFMKLMYGPDTGPMKTLLYCQFRFGLGQSFGTNMAEVARIASVTQVHQLIC